MSSMGLESLFGQLQNIPGGNQVLEQLRALGGSSSPSFGNSSAAKTIISSMPKAASIAGRLRGGGALLANEFDEEANQEQIGSALGSARSLAQRMSSRVDPNRPPLTTRLQEGLMEALPMDIRDLIGEDQEQQPYEASQGQDPTQDPPEMDPFQRIAAEQTAANALKWGGTAEELSAPKQLASPQLSPEFAGTQMGQEQGRRAEVAQRHGPNMREFTPGQFYRISGGGVGDTDRVSGTGRRNNFANNAGQAQLKGVEFGGGTLSMADASGQGGPGTGQEILPSHPLAKQRREQEIAQHQSAMAEAKAQQARSGAMERAYGPDAPQQGGPEGKEAVYQVGIEMIQSMFQNQQIDAKGAYDMLIRLISPDTYIPESDPNQQQALPQG